MAVYRLGEATPMIAESAYVAPNATLIGKVALADRVSVWFGATLRGDNELISIGMNSNVQEATVMHTDMGFPLTVGANVTIGHQAMLHGCTIADGALIGIQAVVLNGAVIGKQCLVGAGAIVTERQQFPDRSLILGAPAKVIRKLTNEEVADMLHGAEHYVRRGAQYKAELRRIDE
jgi:carbonic anhydrase/acetyltransferase-like protein (isoleucine patch superfamily)